MGAIFSPAALTFLRGLARHNDKAWFEAHRDAYERDVRAPMRELIEEMDVRLASVAPEIVGDPKASPFRIHRDVRFSKDKSPYKTFVACWFFHRDAGRTAAPHDNGGAAGFYFHLEPDASISAGGLYRPPRAALAKVREALDENPRGLAKSLGGACAERFGALTEEYVLTRPPRGYAADHPAAPWLRFTSFTSSRRLTDADVTSASLADTLAEDFAALTPLVRWLNSALGHRPASRR
ncbi:MAG TPA: DUF2461 domain-containing protein [Gemmatimonadaceae bacterium]|nr:DUF2461 domain-containing protein [Gemmatimonadaceae bacterium]